MKSNFLMLIMLITGLTFLNAVKLPDGTDAVVQKVEKYENGKIKSVVLSEPTDINTPIGKFIFSNSGNSQFMGIGGDASVEFYENGNFKSGYLDQKTFIQTPKGKFETTYLSFYENGKLHSFNENVKSEWVRQGGYGTKKIISTPQIQTSLGLIAFSGDIELYNSGKIKRVSFGAGLDGIVTTIKLNGTDLKVENQILFYENGKVEMIYLDKPQLIITNLGKLICENEVYFWSNGNFKNAQLGKGQAIETPAGVLNLTKIETFESGDIKSCSLNETQTIDANIGKYECYDDISFYESGHIRETTLNYEDQRRNESVINTSIGKLIVTGTQKFYDNGNLQYSELWDLSDTNFINTVKGELRFENVFFYENGNFKGGYVKYGKNENNDLNQKYCLFDESGNYAGIAEYDEDKCLLQSFINEKLIIAISENNINEIEEIFQYYQINIKNDINTFIMNDKTPLLIYAAINGNKDIINYFFNMNPIIDKYQLLNENHSIIDINSNLTYLLPEDNYSVLSVYIEEKQQEIEAKRIADENIAKEKELKEESEKEAALQLEKEKEFAEQEKARLQSEKKIQYQNFEKLYSDIDNTFDKLDYSLRDGYGNTFLMRLLLDNNTKTAEKIIKKNLCQLDTLNTEKQTALDIANSKYQTKISGLINQKLNPELEKERKRQKALQIMGNIF